MSAVGEQPESTPDPEPDFAPTLARVAWVVEVGPEIGDDDLDLTDPRAIAQAGYDRIVGHDMQPVLGVMLLSADRTWRILDDVDLDVVDGEVVGDHAG